MPTVHDLGQHVVPTKPDVFHPPASHAGPTAATR
jgi:hypothetical protein